MKQNAAEIAHLRDVMELRFELSDKALDIQAKEYERRLIDLNHEAARLKAAAALAVSVEKYEAERAADHSRISDLERRLQETKDSLLTVVIQRAAQSKWIAVIISLGVSLLGIVVNLFLS